MCDPFHGGRDDLWMLDENHNPVAGASIVEWGEQRDAGLWRVDWTEFHTPGQADPVQVSTVFLGIDHGFGGLFGGDPRPLLFESMIFNGPHDQEQWRYHTWGEAQEGHNQIVAKLKASYIKADGTF